MKRLFTYYVKIKQTQTVFVIFMTVAIALFLIRAVSLNGSMFRDVFQHYDLVDSGMDFFNSIVCTSYGEPYRVFKTLYPPLANLFFYVCYLCIPDNISSAWQVNYDTFNTLRNGVFDLRTWQHSFVIFLVYVQVVALGYYLIVDKMLVVKNKIFSFLILFTFGMLFALERGNIIVAACLFTMFFVHYSRVGISPIVKEMALLSLSIAVGLKVYPAIFSLLLIREKRFIDFFKVCIYSAFAFFMPFFAFNGIEDIYTWIETAKYIGTRNEMAIGTVYFGFTQVIKTALSNKAYSSFILEYINLTSVLSISRYFTIVILAVMSLNAILTKHQWKALLSFALIIILTQQHSPIYNTIFLIPAFIEFINDNEIVNKNNFLYFTCFCIILVPLPAFGFYKTLFVIRFFALICMAVKLLFSSKKEFCMLKSEFYK